MLELKMRRMGEMGEMGYLSEQKKVCFVCCGRGTPRPYGEVW
jgi:hypothetical protein